LRMKLPPLTDEADEARTQVVVKRGSRGGVISQDPE